MMLKSKGHSMKIAADNTVNVISKTNEIVTGYADLRTAGGFASVYWT